jgi:hypothetical protein
MHTPITITKITGAVVSGESDAEKIAHINATAEIQAAPESLRHLPARDLTSEDNHQILALLGIAGEMKIAANNGGKFDVKILDNALAKSQLSIEDRFRVKLSLCGTGFSRN